MNTIQEQYGYGQQSGAEVSHGGNASPVGSKTWSPLLSSTPRLCSYITTPLRPPTLPQLQN